MLPQDAGVILDLSHDSVYRGLHGRSRAHLAVELRQLLLESGDGRDDIVLAPVGLLRVHIGAHLILGRKQLPAGHGHSRMWRVGVR